MLPRIARGLLIVSPLVAWGACAAKTAPAPGQLILAVQTDMSIPKDIDEVRLEVSTYGSIQFANSYAVGPSGLRIPATLTVVAGKDPTIPVTIRAIARRQGAARVLRESVTTVPPNRIATLRVPIQFMCLGDKSVKETAGTVEGTCPAGQTCHMGACVDAKVDSTTLPDYSPADVFGGGSGAGDGACFDTSPCFTGATPVTPAGPDCAFPLPPGASGDRVNVGLVTGSSAAGGICDAAGRCVVPLDRSDTAGWRLEGSTVRLPPAICGASGLTTVVSTACGTKTERVPTCGPWSSVSTPADAGAPADTGTPPPSATVVASGQKNPRGVASDGTAVYWITDDGIARCAVTGCPGAGPHPFYTGTVAGLALTTADVVFGRSPATTGEITACAKSSPCPGRTVASLNALPSAVAATGGAAAWLAASSPAVQTCGDLTNGCGAAPPSRAMTTPGGLAFGADGFIYFAERGGPIQRCPAATLATCTPETMLTSQDATALRLRGTTQLLWLNANGDLKDCPLASCSPGGPGQPLAAGVIAFDADASGVFVARPSGTGYEIAEALGLASARTLVLHPTEIVSVAVDATRVFFTDKAGAVMSVERGAPGGG